MNLHEYQSRELFIKYGIPVPEGYTAQDAAGAADVYNRLKRPVVIKAQVLTGGRGKAGGVKEAGSEDEVKQYAAQILGMDIKGHTVRKVLVAEAVEYAKEIYLAVTIDRTSKKIVLMASPCGGVDIEETAGKEPDKIYKVYINPLSGIKPYHIRFITDRIKEIPEAIIKNLYRLFTKNDCLLAEINPLVCASSGEITACDAKISIDDNALYRYPGLEEKRDTEDTDPMESEARRYGLSYIGLGGDTACVVNGAGLAMATMDSIKIFGGIPANFLDVGGSSNPGKTRKALDIITRNKRVKSILINIFGGITRCDDIAEGIICAMEELNIKVPVVARLTGTNQDKAGEMLSQTKLILAETMNEAIKKAVKQAE